MSYEVPDYGEHRKLVTPFMQVFATACDPSVCAVGDAIACFVRLYGTPWRASSSYPKLIVSPEAYFSPDRVPLREALAKYDIWVSWHWDTDYEPGWWSIRWGSDAVGSTGS